MDQSVYNLWRPLFDFLWDLPAVGTGQDRNPNKQAFMLHVISAVTCLCDLGSYLCDLSGYLPV